VRNSLIFCISITLIIHNCAEKKLPIETLIQAEKQFCKKSVKEGIRSAFLTYLVDDAIVFDPHPVKGKPLYMARKKSTAVLKWTPIFADISKAGDLGYTTGPFEYKKNESDSSKIYYGRYVSIWQKQDEGKWKVVLDVGISHSKIEKNKLELNKHHPKVSYEFSFFKSVDQEIERMKIIDVEKHFSTIAQSKGLIEALKKFSSDSIRIYRDGQFPFVGLKDFKNFIKNESFKKTFEPMQIFVSVTGDIGYSYGISKSIPENLNRKKANAFSYLNIWKKQNDNKWKIVLNLENQIMN
jgi:ketosteroid isomerase-like protein